MPMYERLQEQEEALYANTEPMLLNFNRKKIKFSILSMGIVSCLNFLNDNRRLGL